MICGFGANSYELAIEALAARREVVHQVLVLARKVLVNEQDLQTGSGTGVGTEESHRRLVSPRVRRLQ